MTNSKKHDVCLLNSGTNNLRNSEGAFASLADGRIIYIYSCYSGQGSFDHANADLAMRIGSPDGQRWDNNIKIAVNHGNSLNVMSVSLLRLKSGRILLFYLRKDTVGDGQQIICMPKMRFSDNEGNSWSDEIAITPIPEYYIINNDRAIQLANGRIILPFSFYRWTKNGLDIRGIIGCFCTDDEGDSFKELPGLILPPQHSPNGLQEPGLVELENGKLLCFARTDLGCQYRSESTDGGESWSPVVPWSDFQSPLSPMSIKRNPFTGVLLAVWNDQSSRWGFPAHEYISLGFGAGSMAGRTPLVMAESYDDGQSWTNHRLLESDRDRGFCYTAIHFLQDAVLLAYCCGKEKLDSQGKNTGSLLKDSKIVRVT